MPDTLDLIVEANLTELIINSKPLEVLIETLDKIAREHDSYELGLPRYNNAVTAQMHLAISNGLQKIKGR